MTSSTALRFSVVLEWAFLGLATACSFAMHHHLPAPLQDWWAAELERDFTFVGIVILMLFLPICLGWITSSIGLLFLKGWAAWLYLFSHGAAYMLLPFTGPIVDHALPATLEVVGVVFSGVAIGLAFFTDALKRPGRAEQTTVRKRLPAGK